MKESLQVHYRKASTLTALGDIRIDRIEPNSDVIYFTATDFKQTRQLERWLNRLALELSGSMKKWSYTAGITSNYPNGFYLFCSTQGAAERTMFRHAMAFVKLYNEARFRLSNEDVAVLLGNEQPLNLRQFDDCYGRERRGLASFFELGSQL